MTHCSRPLLFLVLALPLCAEAQGKPDTALPDPVVASGRGFEIKRSTLRDFVINYRTRQAGDQRVIPDAAIPELASHILDHLVLNKILAQEATAEEKDLANKQAALLFSDYTNSRSPSVVRAELLSSGETVAGITARTAEEQLAKAVLVRVLVPSNDISDAAVKQYYDSHQEVFAVPEKVRVAQILITTRDRDTSQPLPADQKMERNKLALELKSRLGKGDDFAKLAIKYSDDLDSTNKGGEIPAFSRQQLSLQFEALAQAAFTLKTNQVSDVVETVYGYHILKLLEKIPPSTEPLDKVFPAIKTHLVQLAVEKALPDYEKKLEKEYDVKYFTSDLDVPPTAQPAAGAQPPPAKPK